MGLYLLKDIVLSNNYFIDNLYLYVSDSVCKLLKPNL